MDSVGDQFVGTWRLVSFVAHAADGRETNTYGANPHGLLMYDNNGRMAVQIAPSDRTPLRPGDAVERFFGYFGRYTVEEPAGTVTHHIEGSSYPNFVGTDQRRHFTLENNRLVLSTPPGPTDGSDVTYVVTWERQP